MLNTEENALEEIIEKYLILVIPHNLEENNIEISFNLFIPNIEDVIL